MDVTACKERLSFIEHGNLNENSQKIEQPSEFKIKLKNHQLAMIFAMRNAEDSNILIENCSNNSLLKTSMGVIGDSVAAGKTYDILGNIALCPVIYNHPTYVQQYGLRTIQVETNRRCNDNFNEFIESNLVIVPHALVNQWKTAIENTKIPFTVLKTRKQVVEFDLDDIRYQKGITLVSSSIYCAFVQNHRTCIWSRAIFDEADTINIASCPSVDANFLWFITSSLENIVFPSGNYFTKMKLPNNRVIVTRKYIEGIKKKGFIKDMFKSIERPELNKLLRYFIFKNNSKYVQQMFGIQDPNIETIQCHEPDYVNVLSGLVSKEILELLNSGNKLGAIERLGASVDSKENIVSIFTKNIEIKLGNARRRLAFVQSLEHANDNELESRQRRLESIEQEISDLNNKLSHTKKRCMDAKVCPICFDSIENPAMAKCCGASFCMRCITQALVSTNQTCPMCRSHVSLREDLFIVGAPAERQIKCLPTKYEVLLDLIKKKPDGKFLVFSSNYLIFKELAEMLKKNEINSEQIIGTGQRINNIINNYVKKKLNVLLLNAQYYGSGLNLENTTDLVFMHRMSKELEKQVIGRAQRYGRNSKLNVYYLCHKNELIGLPHPHALPIN